MLRYELGFDGFLVTDYGEINGLHGEHAIAKDNREAVRGFVGGDVVAVSPRPTDPNHPGPFPLIWRTKPRSRLLCETRAST